MLYAVKDAISRLPLGDDWQHIADTDTGGAILTMCLNGHWIDANITSSGSTTYSYAVPPVVIDADDFADAKADPKVKATLDNAKRVYDASTRIECSTTLSERHAIAGDAIRAMLGGSFAKGVVA